MHTVDFGSSGRNNRLKSFVGDGEAGGNGKATGDEGKDNPAFFNGAIPRAIDLCPEELRE